MTRKKPPSTADMAGALDTALMWAMEGSPLVDKDGATIINPKTKEPYMAPPEANVLGIMEKRVRAKEAREKAATGGPDGLTEEQLKGIHQEAAAAGGPMPDVEDDT